MKDVNRELENTKAVKQLLQLLQDQVYLPESRISSKKCESLRESGMKALTKYKDDFHQLREAFLKSNLLGSKESIDLVLRKYYSENVFISDRYIHFLFEVENSDLAIESILNETSFLPSKSTIWNDFNKLKLSEHLSSSHLDERLDAYSIFLEFSGFRDAKRFDFRLDKKQEHEAKESIEDEIVVFFKENTQRNSKRLKKPPFTYIPPSITVSGFGLIRMFNRLKWYLGIRNWCYDWGENPPLGFTKTVVKAITSEYISSDFQSDTFVYEDADNREKDVLKRMYEELFGKPQGGYESCAYHFLFASSGIGKTSLVLRILVELKRRQYSDRRVYAIPFSNWRELSAMNQVEKEGAVIFLEAMDEDFSLSSPKHIESIINEFREATIGFDHIVITTRGEFFQRNEVLKKFTKATSEYPNYRYTMTVLCPFSDQQIQTFLNKNFRSRADKEKALRVINVIGRENINRQFLISKIRYLFTFLDSNKIIDDCKEYMLFDYMLKNWLRHERSTFNKILRQSDDERKTALENTYEFSKALSYLIYTRETDLANGFTFEEIINQLSNKFEQTEILINRTFLIREVNDLYRFAHKSVFEFFLSQFLVDCNEPSLLEKAVINVYVTNSNLLTQAKYARIVDVVSDLLRQKLICDIQLTDKVSQVDQYCDEMRFEPFFNGTASISKSTLKEAKNEFCITEWDSLDCLTKNPSFVDDILGIKFSQKNHSRSSCLEIELEHRLRSLNHIREILPFFMNVVCLDLSSMGLENVDDLITQLPNLRILNLRNNNISNFTCKSKAAFSCINVRGNNSDLYSNLSIMVDKLIIDFNELLFQSIKKDKIKVFKEILIYLKDDQLTSGSLDDLKRLEILGFKQRFNVKAFTSYRVLDEYNSFPLDESKLNAFDDLYGFSKFSYYQEYGLTATDSIGLDKRGLERYFILSDFFDYYTDLPIDRGIVLTLHDKFSKLSWRTITHIYDLLSTRIGALSIFLWEPDVLVYLNRLLNFKVLCDFLIVNVPNIQQKRLNSNGVEIQSKSEGDWVKEQGLKEYNASKQKAQLENSGFDSKIVDKPITDNEYNASFGSIKHILISNHLDNDVFDPFNPRVLESIFVNGFASHGMFSSSPLRCMENLKRVHLNVTGKVDIDFSDIINLDIMESICIVQTQDNEDLKISSFALIERMIHLESLVLIISRNIESSLEASFSNLSVRNLIVSDWLFGLSFSKSEISRLERMVLLPNRIDGEYNDSWDFETISEYRLLKSLEIWSKVERVQNVNALKKSTLAELIMVFDFPSGEERFKELDQLIQGVLRSGIRKFECVLVLKKQLDSHDKNSLYKLLEYVLNTEMDFVISLTLPKGSYMANEVCLNSRINISNVKKENKIELLAPHKIQMKINRGIEVFLFKEVFDVLKSLFPSAKIIIGDVWVSDHIFRNQRLDLFKESFKDISSWHYINFNFLNSNFDFSQNAGRFITGIPLKWVRIINFNLIDKMGILFPYFRFVEKVSLSSFKSSTLHDLLKLKLLKEVEVLLYYMPEGEQEAMKDIAGELLKNNIEVTYNHNPLNVLEHREGIILESVVE